MAEKKQRLGRQEWINAGFRALAARGPEGLRVEQIARELGATKGSFYWHFKDLSALHIAMLEYWEEAATHRIIAQLAEVKPGLPRLLALAEAVNMPHDAQGGPGAETAIRGWGRTFDLAGAAVERVDTTRLAFLQDCLRDLGADDAGLPAMLYAAHLGLEQLSVRDDVDPAVAMKQLIALIAAQSAQN